jgi:hypothetical protein
VSQTISQTLSLHDPNYHRNLEGGLVLRWSNIVDTDQIAALYSTVFREKPENPPNRFMDTWTRDLMSGRHPYISPDDFAVVEDTSTKTIIAATSLLENPVRYGDISFMMGRPEIVATMVDYRNRGAIRAIFELIHARSESRGHLMQGITGIPYYYRLFGYEYAIELENFHRIPFGFIPTLKKDEAELFTLQPAEESDIPLICTLYERETKDMPIAVVMDENYLRWAFLESNKDAGNIQQALMIVDGNGQKVGYLMTTTYRWRVAVSIFGCATIPEVSIVSVIPSILRGIQQYGVQLPSRLPDAPPVSMIQLGLPNNHPLVTGIDPSIIHHTQNPYAWYIRIPDLPAFIHKITPVLEQRLADSGYSGLTDEYKIEFYRGGLLIQFEKGKLIKVESWQRNSPWDTVHAGFPPLVFTKLLLQYRSLSDLKYAYPDVWTGGNLDGVLNVLFPQHTSFLFPMD